MTFPDPEQLLEFAPAACILIVVIALIKGLSLFAAKRRLSVDYKRTLIPQFLVVVVAVIGFMILILALPMTHTTRGQVLGLFGVVFTGIIALSSTTFVTNALAGLMLRLIRNYKAGDFIRVNEMFGRITERGLFHTEIQTEERDLTTFPNIYLITNPITVVRSSGTILSASLSLGYDIPHRRIDALLVDAAERVGLKEPFVQVMELGDFSVTYKISGFLSDTKQMLATRSHLKRAVMDALHNDGLEIVSPNFMNQRTLSSDVPVIPESDGSPEEPTADTAAPPENLIFDKADIAEAMDMWREKLIRLAEKRDSLLKKKDKSNDETLKKIEAAIVRIEHRIAKFNAVLEKDETSTSTSA